jgi:hypothetical protein
MADVHIWRIAGAGDTSAYKVVGGVDQLIGTTVNGNGTFLYNTGDVFKFVSVPGSGWVFQKYCNSDPCTDAGTITTATFTGTITQPTGNLYVYFAPGPGTVNITRSSGIGEVDAYKLVGGTYQLVATTVDGSGTATYTIGDEFKFVAIPGPGNTFQKYCGSDPCTDAGTITTDVFTGNITQPTGNLYVYFTGTPSASGGGSVFALIAGVVVLGIVATSQKPQQKPKPTGKS